MNYDRASKGNQAGIKAVKEGSDPLERHTFMIPKSMAKILEKIVYESKKKTNKSELVREAIRGKYITS